MFYLEGKVRRRAGLSNTHRVLAIAIATSMNAIVLPKQKTKLRRWKRASLLAV